MPTAKEIDELITKCTWALSTLNSVAGITVTGPNGNSIFLPTAGRYNKFASRPESGGQYGNYWSGTAIENNDRVNSPILYYQQSDAVHYTHYADRACGLPIRPVKPKPIRE